jgi:hypothetical protein
MLFSCCTIHHLKLAKSINRVSVVSSTRDAAKQGFCVPPLPSVHSGQSYETQSAAAIQ